MNKRNKLLCALALTGMLALTPPAALWADDGARYASYRVQINEETADAAQYFLTGENALYVQLDQIAPYLGLNVKITNDAVTLASEARVPSIDRLRLEPANPALTGSAQGQYAARTERELALICNVMLGRYLSGDQEPPAETLTLGGADAFSFACAVPANTEPELDLDGALSAALRAWRLYGSESLRCRVTPIYNANTDEWEYFSISFRHSALSGIPEANRPTAAQDSAAYVNTVNQLLYYDSFIDRGDAKKAELRKIIMLHDFMGQLLQWDYHNPQIDPGKMIYSDALAVGSARNFEDCTPHMMHFAALAQFLGLETGLARNTHETGHNWNTVRYDGAWYHLDSRMDDYDDPALGANLYRYALKSDADLQAAYYLYRGIRVFSFPGLTENYDPALFTKSVPTAEIRSARLGIEKYPYISSQLVQNATTPAIPATQPATLDGTAQNLSLYKIGGRIFVKLDNIVNAAGAGLQTTGSLITVYF
ncbi:MAG: hypothetical protein LBK56_02710 [Gracilibacteraceae bacterium]|nr:hypothetical protein [Gracilibacteraceae bacterium]